MYHPHQPSSSAPSPQQHAIPVAPLALPLHPALTTPDPRPHTAHASSSSSSATYYHDDDPDHAALMPSLRESCLEAAHRSLSRDDTAADLSTMLTARPSHAPNGNSDLSLPCRDALPPWADTVHTDVVREVRRPRRRSTWKLSTTSLHSSAESSSSVFPKSQSLGRKFSKTYKEGFRDGLKDFKDKIRRSSAMQSADSASHFSRASSVGTSIVQPTSPSKRNGRHGDDRPKKHFRNIISSDRKDTPAPPPAYGLQRPASRHLSGAVLTLPGSSSASASAGARRSAAAWKGAPSQFSDLAWLQQQDLNARRSRVGSLSSAADSGADLSSYAGSSKDSDGDAEMTTDDAAAAAAADQLQIAHDFVAFLPSEISLQIFEYLEANDLMTIESVSRSWREMADQTCVWRNAFLRKFQRKVFTDPAPVQVGGAGCGLANRPNQEWKKMFKARVLLERNWRKGPDDAGKAVYLSGHTDSVYCLQFDEEKIITGSRDRTIRVWDINNFTCKMVIGGPNVKPTPGPKVLRTVDYPDFHIATASVNGTAYGDSVFKVPSQWHDASILCLQYDDKILVTGSSDCDLLIWDIKTFEPIRRLRKHTGGVLDVALDAKHIVSCSKDSRIIVWNRETFEPKGELTGHRGPVNAVQLRGKFLASASGDGIARLWDVEQMKLVKEFSAKERGLAAVEFSEDMKHVLAGGNDTITYKFETDTGREVQQFTGHTQLVRSLWLDGQNGRVVTGSYDLDIRVYDFETGQQIWRAEEWTTSWMLAAKSDYRRIVATSQDGRILLVDFGLHKGSDINDGQPIENVELLRGTEHTTAITWRNPWEWDREQLRLGLRGNGARQRQSSVAAEGEAPAVSFW